LATAYFARDVPQGICPLAGDLFEFGGRDVAAVPAGVAVVEPTDPIGGGELDPLRCAKARGPADLGRELAVDRLGQCVVTGGSDGPDRGSDADLGEALTESDRRAQRTAFV